MHLPRDARGAHCPRARRDLGLGDRSTCSAAIAIGRSPVSTILGLAWLLNGGKIIELHPDRAIIETERGARQSYRRRPVDLGRVVLAWELKP